MGHRHTRDERLKYANAAVERGRHEIAAESGVRPETVVGWQREFGIHPGSTTVFAPDALAVESRLDGAALRGGDGGANDGQERIELKAVIDCLADRCDGAISKDDRGFGLATVRAGHYLAMKPLGEWDSDDLDSARSVACIHRHQVEQCGMAMPSSVTGLSATEAKGALAEANSKVLLHFDGRTVTVIGGKQLGSGWWHDKARASHTRSFDAGATPSELAESLGTSLAGTDGEIAVALGFPPELADEIEWHRSECRARAIADKFFVGRVAKGALENDHRGGFESLVDLYRDHQRAGFQPGTGTHGTIHHDEESGAAWVWTWKHARSDMQPGYWYGHRHEATEHLAGGIPWVECTDIRSVRKEPRVGHHIPTAVQLRPRLPGHSIEDVIAVVALKQNLRPGCEAAAQMIEGASSTLRHEAERSLRRQAVNEATRLKEAGVPTVSGFRGANGAVDFDAEAKREASYKADSRRLVEVVTEDGSELWCVRVSGFVSNPLVHGIRVPEGIGG